MILSRRELLSAWRKKRLKFSPDISEDQVSLSSIDLRLGCVVGRLKPTQALIIQPARGFDPTDFVQNDDLSKGGTLGGQRQLRLKPGEFLLALTHEEVTLPPGLAANIQGRSSLARAGLAVHITAPHINPGWSGRITLELFNHGTWELELFPGEDRISQLIVYQVTSPVSKVATTALSTYVKQAIPFPKREAERPIRPATKKPNRKKKSAR